MSVRGVLVGTQRLLGEEAYICTRCGIEGHSRSDRLRDEKGRRKPKMCRDCWDVTRVRCEKPEEVPA